MHAIRYLATELVGTKRAAKQSKKKKAKNLFLFINYFYQSRIKMGD